MNAGELLQCRNMDMIIVSFDANLKSASSLKQLPPLVELNKYCKRPLSKCAISETLAKIALFERIEALRDRVCVKCLVNASGLSATFENGDYLTISGSGGLSTSTASWLPDKDAGPVTLAGTIASDKFEKLELRRSV